LGARGGVGCLRCLLPHFVIFFPFSFSFLSSSSRFVASELQM
jgi:hypothetical protein